MANKNMLISMTVRLDDKASRGLIAMSAAAKKLKSEMAGTFNIKSSTDKGKKEIDSLTSSLLAGAAGGELLATSMAKHGNSVSKVSNVYNNLGKSIRQLPQPKTDNWDIFFEGIRQGLAGITRTSRGIGGVISGWRSLSRGNRDLRTGIISRAALNINPGRAIIIVGENGRMSPARGQGILGNIRARTVIAGARAQDGVNAAGGPNGILRRGMTDIGGGLRDMAVGIGNTIAGTFRAGGAIASAIAGLIQVIGPTVAALGNLITSILSTAFKVVTAVVRTFANVVGFVFNGIIKGAQLAGRAIRAIGITTLIVGGGLLVSLGLVAKSTLDAAVEFEGLGAKMETAFRGNIPAAKEMTKWATEFAAQTPFEVPEVVDAAVRLKMQDLDPKALVGPIGNMSSAMGKSLEQGVEAYLDATRGEFERLKEFGITNLNLIQNGANAAKGGGISSQKPGDAEAIKGSLDKIIATRFGGAMKKQSDIAIGSISNFKDAIGEIRRYIGNLLLPTFKEWIVYGRKIIDWLKQTGVFDMLANAVLRVGNAFMQFAAQALVVLVQVAQSQSFQNLISSVLGLGSAFAQLISEITGGASPAQIITAIIDKMVVGISWLVALLNPQNVATISSWFIGLWTSVSTFLGAAFGYIANNAPIFGEWIQYIAKYILFLYQSFMNSVPKIGEIVLNMADILIPSLLSIAGVLNSVGGAFKIIFDIIKIGVLASMVVMMEWQVICMTAILAVIDGLNTVSKAFGLPLIPTEFLNNTNDWFKSVRDESWKGMGEAIADVPATVTSTVDRQVALDNASSKYTQFSAGARQWVGNLPVGGYNPMAPTMPTGQLTPWGTPANIPMVPSMSPLMPATNYHSGYNVSSTGSPVVGGMMPVTNTQEPNIQFYANIDIRNGNPAEVKQAMDEWAKNNFPRYYRQMQGR